MLARRLADCVAIWSLVLIPLTTFAQITLDADFDSGSLCLIPSNACDDNGTASSVNGNTVTLVGRDNFNPGQWKWVYFRASGVNGQLVNFEIGDDFATGSSSLADHAMVYSYDQENWSFFDNNQLQNSQDKFVFSNNSAFTQDEVYVAYGLPYPYQRTVDHTNQVSSSPWVSELPSGFGSFVIGQSPGGTDDIGRSIAPRDLFGYKITDSASTANKKKIVVAGGVHSNETLGNFTLEGLVDFLVGEDLQAAQLRRYAEFFVYPMVNPDGRFAGYNRSTVQFPNEDPNRNWDPSDNYGGLTDLRQVGQAMRFDTGQDIDYMIDFHSTVNPANAYHFGFVLPEWQNDPFWQQLLTLEPQLLTADSSLISFTGAKFGRDELGAEFSSTFETRFIEGENVDRFLDLGENFGLAWHDVFFVAGDLNFDGKLNGLDWLEFIGGAETDMAQLSDIERYARGDLNGDGENNILDFDIFFGTYEQTFGNGSFAAMLKGIPEPSSAWLLVAASSVLLFRRSQVRLNC